ncbi:hypothetical protein ACUOI1_26135, partial [Escherichia coli]
ASLQHIAEGKHGAEGKQPTPVEESLAKVECEIAKLEEASAPEPAKVEAATNATVARAEPAAAPAKTELATANVAKVQGKTPAVSGALGAAGEA